MSRYLFQNIWNIALCGIMSAMLLITFAQCFYIPDGVADNVPLALAVSFAVVFLAYLAWYSRIGITLFFLGFALAAVVFFFWLRASGIDIVDTEGSDTAVYIYVFAAALFPVYTFFLSKGRVGICVLSGTGICLFGLADYLNYEASAAACACYVVSGIVLFALRLYRLRALSGRTYEPRFGRLGMSALVTGAASLAAAAGIYAAVIAPLSPPTRDIEFLTVFLKWDRTDVVGVGTHYFVFNKDLVSFLDNLGELESTNRMKNEQQEEMRQNPSEEQTDEEAAGEESGGGDGVETPFSVISYDTNALEFLLAAAVVLVVAAVAAVPLIRRFLWNRRIQAAKRLSPPERVMMLCRFYMKHFRLLGYPKPPYLTELEYARSVHTRLDAYTAGTFSVEELMGIYAQARYGNIAPDEPDDERLLGFYPVFKENYRKKNGNVKYLLHYFKL